MVASRWKTGRLGAFFAASIVAVGGSALSIATAMPVLFVLRPADGMAASAGGFAALFVASYVGYALAGAVYLAWSGRGLGYLDVRLPTLGDVGYVVAGIFSVFAAVVVVGLVVTRLGVESTPHNLFEAGMDPSILLVLLPLVLFVNAPVEELVFRNVVQKRLAENFSQPTAVILASAIFAVVHLPAYFNPMLSATAVSLAVVFVASLVFGTVYARTRNVVVPSVVHGIFNAVQIAAFYLFVSGEETLGVGMSTVPGELIRVLTVL